MGSRGRMVAPDGGHQPGLVEPGAASRRFPPGVPVRASGVLRGRDRIIILLKPIRSPLPDVACHVMYAVWADSLGVRAHRNGIPAAGAVPCQLAGHRLISPGEDAFICPAGSFFPFRLGRQSPAAPFTKALRFVPGNIHDWVANPG